MAAASVAGPYGSSFNTDTRANLHVGGGDRAIIDILFTAKQNSTLDTVRLQHIHAYSSGYGGGNGGTIRIAVEADDGFGYPKGWFASSGTRGGTGAPLAYVDWVADARGDPALYLKHTFAAPAALVAGTRYHLVQTNIDANQTANFVSANMTFCFGSALSPRQPGWADTEFSVNRKTSSGSWAVQRQYTPNVDLGYGNGAHQGQGYVGVTLTKAVIAGSSTLVRERFTVSGGDRVVSGAAVRLAKTSGSGDLVVRLEDASGTLIDSFAVSTGSVPILPSNDSTAGVWVSGAFSARRSLTNGATYNLRLSTDSSTSLWTRGIQKGGMYGFDPATYFADGLIQVTTNGGASWSDVPGLGKGDLQFYLH